MPLAFVGVHVGYAHQDSRLLHVAEFWVQGCAEGAHGAGEPDVGFDERGDLLAEVGQLGVEDLKVLLVASPREDAFHLGPVYAELQGELGPCQVVGVGEVALQEVVQRVARLLIVVGVHGYLAEKVLHVGVQHHQRAEPIPEVVEGVYTLPAQAR